MKVVIDALSQVGAGSRTYLANVLPRLSQSHWGNTYFILWPAGKDIPLSLSESANMSFYRVNIPQKPMLPRLLYEQLIVPIIAKKGDVFFAPIDVGPLLAPCPVVLAIRNPNPFFHIPRSLTSRAKLTLKKMMISLSARQAERVIFVSDHSKSHITPQVRIPPERACTIYHGIDHNKFRADKAETRSNTLPPSISGVDSYILSVSTITPHKNFEVLLKGYAQLSSQLRSKYALVIAGRVAVPDYFHLLKELALKLCIEKNVHFIGEFPYERIQSLYFGSSVYVLPSLLETFGHTLVEAMASRVPIVASRTSCIPEIVQDSALFFDPFRPSELAENLEKVLTKRELREKLMAEGYLRAQVFSWDTTVEKLITVLREAVTS